MVVQLGLPLPEITIEDFLHAWKYFDLMSTAKTLNGEKQKSSCQPCYMGNCSTIMLNAVRRYKVTLSSEESQFSA